MKTSPRGGFSLLEVLLALAILLGSIVVLGELARLGMRNAALARGQTQAQLLCESKLNEILCGLEPARTVRDVPFADLEGWLYRVEVEELADLGLTSVQVTVVEDVPLRRHPIEFTLVRWARLEQPGSGAPNEATAPLPEAGFSARPSQPSAADSFR